MGWVDKQPHHTTPTTGLVAFLRESREVRLKKDKPPTPVATLSITLPPFLSQGEAVKQDDAMFREKYEPMKKRRKGGGVGLGG